MSTENISKRPTSITNEHIHFTNTGSSAQLIVGPISIPSVGPTLPMQLSMIVIELVLSIPAAIRTNDITRQMSRYTVRNAKRVTRFCCSTFCPSILSGSTAFSDTFKTSGCAACTATNEHTYCQQHPCDVWPFGSIIVEQTCC